MQYLQFTDESDPEIPDGQPFKAVLITEEACSDKRRAEVSQIIAAAGCLYLMCWGEDCRAWQDAVNLANLQAYDFGFIPDDKLIIATSHPDETREQTFWFAKNTAMHPCNPLTRVVIIHLTAKGVMDSERDMLAAFSAA